MSGWTQQDLDRLTRTRAARPLPDAKSARSKFRNVKTWADGFLFDSEAEADYWLDLKIREKAGEINDLQRQITFPLYAPVMDATGTAATGKMQVVSGFRADFVWRSQGQLVVADKKGHRTQMYLLKRKWLELQQGIVILET